MKKKVDLLCISCATLLGQEERDVPSGVIAIRTQKVCTKCLENLQKSLGKRKWVPFIKTTELGKPVEIPVAIKDEVYVLPEAEFPEFAEVHFPGEI